MTWNETKILNDQYLLQFLITMWTKAYQHAIYWSNKDIKLTQTIFGNIIEIKDYMLLQEMNSIADVNYFLQSETYN